MIKRDLFALLLGVFSLLFLFENNNSLYVVKIVCSGICLVAFLVLKPKKLLGILFIALIGCHNTHKKDSKPLSAGQTEKPNTGYSVENSKKKDYETAHKTRVKEPYKKLVPRILPDIPNQLKPHSRLLLTDVEDRPFFDYFAWQTFIGLVWPVDQNYRGVPDRQITSADFKKYNTNNKSKPNRVPVVWETFRTFNAVLPNTKESIANPPKEWNAIAYSRPFKLDLMSKGSKHGNLDEAFSSPLIDQNRQYVRYNLQMNEVMYEFIRQNKWYLKENLPKSPTQATLPPLPVDPATGKIISEQQAQTNTIVKQPVNGNSIEIKSAWRIMITEEDNTKPWRKKDDLSRYFIAKANIRDAVTGEIKKNQLVGLVGLHIVVKTPQFAQGIWSSFEHNDNVKTQKGSKIRPSFHNDGNKVYKQGFSYQPDALSVKKAQKEELRIPVEVSRVYKIPDTPTGKTTNFPDGLSTVGLNKTYQKLLEGTVWKNYQLVITQWPTDPARFYAKPFLYPRGPKPNSKSLPAIKEVYKRALENAKRAYPKWSGLPIPQVGALNTVMETYFQNPNPDSLGIRQPLENTSCMGCHYGASDMSYSWALKLRTYPQQFNQGRKDKANDSLLRNYNMTKP